MTLITRLNESKTALIIIDMQKGMACDFDHTTGERIHHKFGRGNQPHAEANIKQLLEAWRAAHQPVIHIRHVSRQINSVFQGDGLLFQDNVQPLPNESVFSKHVPDAFCQSELQQHLIQHSIQNLVIVGGITNNSVESTARSAGNLGFSTTVVADACFTFGQNDFGQNWRSAYEVHDMTLANLQMDYAQISNTAQILTFYQP